MKLFCLPSGWRRLLQADDALAVWHYQATGLLPFSSSTHGATGEVLPWQKAEQHSVAQTGLRLSCRAVFCSVPFPLTGVTLVQETGLNYLP